MSDKKAITVSMPQVAWDALDDAIISAGLPSRSEFARKHIPSILLSDNLNAFVQAYRETVPAEWKLKEGNRNSLSLDPYSMRVLKGCTSTLREVGYNGRYGGTMSQTLRMVLTLASRHRGSTNGIPGIPHAFELPFMLHLDVPSKLLRSCNGYSDWIERCAAAICNHLANTIALCEIHDRDPASALQRIAFSGGYAFFGVEHNGVRRARSDTQTVSIKTERFKAELETIVKHARGVPYNVILSWLVAGEMHRQNDIVSKLSKGFPRFEPKPKLLRKLADDDFPEPD